MNALGGEDAKPGEALRSDVDILSALRQTQILIECLSTDTKIPSYLGFLLTFRYAEFHLVDLFAVERFLAATISFPLFCKLNPFPLPLRILLKAADTDIPYSLTVQNAPIN